ncbi:hypothetical protein MNBD_DELTA01-300 [hydrothermal vent metagenome]|uniref:Uncharacterized protein n=1 Tax=hydrothermal vent metagenome TaxID=652676 RepID=A0A3B0REV2_9ZZZZ
MTNYGEAGSCGRGQGVNIRLAELCIVLVVILAMSLTTYVRNVTWFDKYSMWDDILEKSESKGRPHFRMGLILYKDGDYEQALSRFLRAYELKPDARGLLNNIGLTYQRMGRFGEASTSYDRAVESGDSVSLAYMNQGTLYLRQGDLKRALSYFARSIESDPKNAVAHVNAGFTYSDLGMYGKAIEFHRRAAEINPYYANASYGLAIALEGSGQMESALREWRRYLEVGPKSGPWRQRALLRIKRLESIITSEQPENAVSGGALRR